MPQPLEIRPVTSNHIHQITSHAISHRYYLHWTDWTGQYPTSDHITSHFPPHNTTCIVPPRAVPLRYGKGRHVHPQHNPTCTTPTPAPANRTTPLVHSHTRSSIQPHNHRCTNSMSSPSLNPSRYPTTRSLTHPLTRLYLISISAVAQAEDSPSISISCYIPLHHIPIPYRKPRQPNPRSSDPTTTTTYLYLHVSTHHSTSRAQLTELMLNSASDVFLRYLVSIRRYSTTVSIATLKISVPLTPTCISVHTYII